MRDGEDQVRVVTFRVGGDLYAADVAAVERVLPWIAAHPVPSLPVWIDGVVEHEGRVIPVVDLRKRFGHIGPPPGPASRLLVLRGQEEWIGALVDAVLDVRVALEADLSPPPPLVRGLAGVYVRAIWRRDASTLVVLLDIERLLAEQGALAAPGAE